MRDNTIAAEGTKPIGSNAPGSIKSSKPVYIYMV